MAEKKSTPQEKRSKKQSNPSKKQSSSKTTTDPALKIDLAETAVAKWMIHPSFSLSEVATAHNISLRELLLQFKNREALLSYYYDSRWVLFQTLKEQVPNYDAYTVEEKLSNLFYSMIELMSPQKEFVRKTSRSSLFCKFRSDFQAEMRSIFSGNEVSNSAKIVLATPVSEFLWLSFIGVLQYWISDTSTEGENTAALIDKGVAVISELASNSLGDKVIDLGRFLLREFPLSKEWGAK